MATFSFCDAFESRSPSVRSRPVHHRSVPILLLLRLLHRLAKPCRARAAACRDRSAESRLRSWHPAGPLLWRDAVVCAAEFAVDVNQSPMPGTSLTIAPNAFGAKQWPGSACLPGTGFRCRSTDLFERLERERCARALGILARLDLQDRNFQFLPDDRTSFGKRARWNESSLTRSMPFNATEIDKRAVVLSAVTRPGDHTGASFAALRPGLGRFFKQQGATAPRSPIGHFPRSG